MVLLVLAVVGSIVAGETIKDRLFTRRLAGPWIGREEDPGGQWVREIAYDFRPEGTVEVTLRFQRAGEPAPEVSSSVLSWSIRNSHLILTSPSTGDIATLIRRLRSDELAFGGQAKVREFRRPES